MRTMLKIQIPVEAGNEAIDAGVLPSTLQEVLGRLQPEAAYFVPDGQRTAWVVFDLKDPSQIPSVAEPLFHRLNAHVSLTPVMNLEDLQKGLKESAQA